MISDVDDTDRVYENNMSILEDIRSGVYDDDEDIKRIAFGSFLMILFYEDRFIELFTNMLAEYTGKDYATEKEVLMECFSCGKEELLAYLVGKIAKEEE